jgi:hypothetical protein
LLENFEKSNIQLVQETSILESDFTFRVADAREPYKLPLASLTATPKSKVHQTHSYSCFKYTFNVASWYFPGISLFKGIASWNSLSEVNHANQAWSVWAKTTT